MLGGGCGVTEEECFIGAECCVVQADIFYSVREIVCAAARRGKRGFAWARDGPSVTVAHSAGGYVHS